MRRDPALGDVMRAVGPCGIERRGDPYRALLRSILYQQLAGAAAGAIERRFKGLYRGRYPTAAALLATSEETLRAAGLSRQKQAAMRAVAEAFASGELSNRRLARMPDADVVEAVTKVHGIGEWTAHMLLMFSLERPDVLPVGDYGVRKGAAVLYGLADLPKPKQLEAMAECWRPYRSVASWYLWRVLELQHRAD
ncbi:MAG TPA: DNA-3-methyladenine glycosylase 2 family protein [Alphaproteobacteria bacterium]|nr:DNA-3-methyladenine glycosylase 2 family protein [Alphaproteobacteria bacterium]